jgi:hypothetical protein
VAAFAIHRSSRSASRRIRASSHLYDGEVGTSGRLGAACGILGPAAFTAAWLLAQRRQDEYELRHEHISGLAARDATDPQLMTAGFFALGTCTVAFASSLDRRLGPRAGAGPALIGVAGLATIAAGLFRRDRRSNFPPPGEPAGQSWVNDVHDLAAMIGGGAGTLGLVALAPALARDPELRDLARPALGAAGASVGLSAIFVSDVVRPGNGLLQRTNVTIPLMFMARLALRLLHHPRRSAAATPTG